MTDHLRVGAHYGISSLFEDYPEEFRINCYTFRREDYERKEAGRIKLVTGKVQILSDLTWDEETLSFAVLHLGDQNMNCGVRRYVGASSFDGMRREVGEFFDNGDVTNVIRLIDRHFQPHTFTVWHLFRDQQRKILGEVLRMTYEDLEKSYRQMYETNYSLMNFLTSMEIPLPRPLLVAAEYVVNRDIRSIIKAPSFDEEKLSRAVSDVRRWSITVDSEMVRFFAGARVTGLLEDFRRDPGELRSIREVANIIEILGRIDMKLDLWKAQNIYFSIAREMFHWVKERAETGDDEEVEWIEAFRNLEPLLGVRIA